ncbi:MAG: 50S ribosomal protein L19e [Candidatus Aenigmarchaeota archaeon]|nr:50S ribosomal protein L19e [Candidatus Aenigmarchaeota archaeon]
MDMPKKKVIAQILKCGVSRVKVFDTKAVEEALTRQDLRNLIRKGVVVKIPKKGTSKAYSRKTLKQKKKGLRTGVGSRRGTWKTRNPKKESWISIVRSLRKLLKDLQKKGKLEKKDYKKLYLMVKGGTFRSKGHLLLYIKERDILKQAKPEKKEKPKKTKK